MDPFQPKRVLDRTPVKVTDAEVSVPHDDLPPSAAEILVGEVGWGQTRREDGVSPCSEERNWISADSTPPAYDMEEGKPLAYELTEEEPSSQDMEDVWVLFGGKEEGSELDSFGAVDPAPVSAVTEGLRVQACCDTNDTYGKVEEVSVIGRQRGDEVYLHHRLSAADGKVEDGMVEGGVRGEVAGAVATELERLKAENRRLRDLVKQYEEQAVERDRISDVNSVCLTEGDSLAVNVSALDVFRWDVEDLAARRSDIQFLRNRQTQREALRREIEKDVAEYMCVETAHEGGCEGGCELGECVCNISMRCVDSYCSEFGSGLGEQEERGDISAVSPTVVPLGTTPIPRLGEGNDVMFAESNEKEFRFVRRQLLRTPVLVDEHGNDDEGDVSSVADRDACVQTSFISCAIRSIATETVVSLESDLCGMVARLERQERAPSPVLVLEGAVPNVCNMGDVADGDVVSSFHSAIAITSGDSTVDQQADDVWSPEYNPEVDSASPEDQPAADSGSPVDQPAVTESHINCCGDEVSSARGDLRRKLFREDDSPQGLERAARPLFFQSSAVNDDPTVDADGLGLIVKGGWEGMNQVEAAGTISVGRKGGRKDSSSARLLSSSVAVGGRTGTEEDTPGRLRYHIMPGLKFIAIESTVEVEPSPGLEQLKPPKRQRRRDAVTRAVEFDEKKVAVLDTHAGPIADDLALGSRGDVAGADVPGTDVVNVSAGKKPSKRVKKECPGGGNKERVRKRRKVAGKVPENCDPQAGDSLEEHTLKVPGYGLFCSENREELEALRPELANDVDRFSDLLLKMWEVCTEQEKKEWAVKEDKIEGVLRCDEQDASVTVTASRLGPLESRAFTALSDKTPGDNQMRAKLEQQKKKKTSNRKLLSKIPDAVERNVISDGDAKIDSLSIPPSASERLMPTKGGSVANEIVSRKRPRAKRESAYVLYCKEMRPQLLVEKPHLSKFLGQQSSELSQQWKALSQEE
eukprot:gene3339-4134_t